MQLNRNVGNAIPNRDRDEQDKARDHCFSANSFLKCKQCNNGDPKPEGWPKVSCLRDDKESEQGERRKQKQNSSDPIPRNYPAQQKGCRCEQNSPAQIKQTDIVGDQKSDSKDCQTDDEPDSK